MESAHQNSFALLGPSYPWSHSTHDIRNLQVALAFQSLDGQSFLTFIALPSSSTRLSLENIDIEHQIQAIRNSIPLVNKHENWISTTFTKFVAGTAGVQQILLPDPRATCSCYKVHLIDFEYHWLLTEIFQDPTTLHEQKMWTDYTAWDRELAGPGQRVTTLCKVLDKAKVAQTLIVLLVISPVLGVVVGHCTKSAEAGLAASASVFALASFIQGIVAWILG